MVIQPNLTSDPASLQNNQTSAKSASRTAASPETDAAQTASADSAALLSAFAPVNQTSAGAEIQNSDDADQSLAFLLNNAGSQPALMLTAQANQIPASVLQLLQP